MTNAERAEWASKLKVGDVVGVYEDVRHDIRMIYESTIVKITKGGKLRMDNGSLYKSDGTKVGGGIYHRRVIGPVGQME